MREVKSLSEREPEYRTGPLPPDPEREERERQFSREYVAWLRRRPKELLQHHLLEWKSVADSVLNRMTPAARERLLRDLVDADPVLFLKLATPVIDRLPFSDEASTSAP